MSLTHYFIQYQTDWIFDLSPLKIMQKSRQVGVSYADSYNSVMLASDPDARFDVFVSSRDQVSAKFYLEDCKFWADFLHAAAVDLGEVAFDTDNEFSAYVLQFSNGRRIYSLSSNPNALAGKRGHVKLDEFALHKDQRLLYRVAKPVTTWGGSLSIISTHRGAGTLFNQLILDITKNGNPMGWSLHTIPIQKAVDQGIVERINRNLGNPPEMRRDHQARPSAISLSHPMGEGRGEGSPSQSDQRAAFLKRLRAECIDEEQWLQEYCCTPADESAAFFSYEMLDACEDPNLTLMSLPQLIALCASPSPGGEGRGEGGISLSLLSALPSAALFLGMDVARKNNLCVIDVAEKIDNVFYDRLRLELLDQSFTQIETQLYALLRLPQLKRACIDSTGMGTQLAEQARERFGWKVEPVNFTAARKEELAFALRRDFEDRRLRIPRDDKLRADLRGLKKEVTPSGNLRFIGETEGSHCDRTWAKALRQHAARHRSSAGAMVI